MKQGEIHLELVAFETSIDYVYMWVCETGDAVSLLASLVSIGAASLATLAKSLFSIWSRMSSANLPLLHIV